LARTKKRGVVACELAITLPLVLLLAFAAADYGRIVHLDQVVSNAARSGAETGATRKFTDYTRSDWEEDVWQSVVEEMSNAPGFDESQLEYRLSTTTDADGLARIIVEVGYPFETAVAWPALPRKVDLFQRYQTRQFR
jgi:Flp pilus assembly protein TadG